MDEKIPQTSKISLNNHVLRRANSSSNDRPSEPAQILPAIHAKIWWKCKNSACRAVLHIGENFCKRCSCCICQLFDEIKDPSLWFGCTAESSEVDSCGLSCHIECALKHGKVIQLDGTYSVAQEAHTLCTLAIKKADELQALKSIPEESPRDEQRNAGQAVEVDNREMRNSASTPTNESLSVICNVPGKLDEDFENCIKVICQLECEGHIKKEFRLKMLPRFSLRSTEAQRQIVCTYILTITDDPSSLVGQLLDTFSDVISSHRQ